MHAIMRPDFSSYYHSPQPDLTGVYEDQKQHHLNKDSCMYGAVLVKMKRIKTGYTLKIRIDWRKWRFQWRTHWGFFMFCLEKEFTEVPDKIIADHLGECN